MPRTLEYHRKLRAKARRAANGGSKNPVFRDIAYHAILRHLYELEDQKSKPLRKRGA